MADAIEVGAATGKGGKGEEPGLIISLVPRKFQFHSIFLQTQGFRYNYIHCIISLHKSSLIIIWESSILVGFGYKHRPSAFIGLIPHLGPALDVWTRRYHIFGAEGERGMA